MSDITFASSIDPAMQAVVLEKLEQLEVNNDIRILFAIESGSRAWGFPSPDSDYDARFVYARPVDWYLSIEPGRDVIELPIEGDLDINGWDIKKALGLLLKPNPVLLEWLSSPIRYRWNDSICDRLIAFSERVSHGPACTHHYLNLGERLFKENIAGRSEIKLKRYFYVLRPALALRWLRMHPQTVPPMNFQAMMAGSDLPANITAKLQVLLRAKAETKELGAASRIEVLDEFVSSEFDLARQRMIGLRAERNELRADADTIFRSIVREVSA